MMDTKEKPNPLTVLSTIEEALEALERDLANLKTEVGKLAVVVRPVAVASALGTKLCWPEQPDLGAQVKRIREASDLTRAQLSTLCGVAESTIRNMETDRHRPTTAILARVLPALEKLLEAPR